MIKDRNGKDLIEADKIKKSWQEYTEELHTHTHTHTHTHNLNNPYNHNGVVTHLEPNILETSGL